MDNIQGLRFHLGFPSLSSLPNQWLYGPRSWSLINTWNSNWRQGIEKNIVPIMELERCEFFRYSFFLVCAKIYDHRVESQLFCRVCNYDTSIYLCLCLFDTFESDPADISFLCYYFNFNFSSLFFAVIKLRNQWIFISINGMKPQQRMNNIFIFIQNPSTIYDHWPEHVEKILKTSSQSQFDIFQIHSIWNDTVYVRICYWFTHTFILHLRAHKYGKRTSTPPNVCKISRLSIHPWHLYAACSCTKYTFFYTCIYFYLDEHSFPTNRLCMPVYWNDLDVCVVLCSMLDCKFDSDWMKFVAHTKRIHTKLHDNFYWWGHPTPKITIIIKLQIAIATVPKNT